MPARFIKGDCAQSATSSAFSKHLSVVAAAIDTEIRHDKIAETIRITFKYSRHRTHCAVLKNAWLRGDEGATSAVGVIRQRYDYK